jgi:dTDP-glucose 4,6-dehydratase
MRQTVLVTGGAGIGAHLVERLVWAGDRVVNLGLLTYSGNRQNLSSVSASSNYVFVGGDIADRGLVSKLLAEYEPHVVFNLAAENQFTARSTMHIEGAYRLLECSLSHHPSLAPDERGAFRFIQISTEEVYRAGLLGPRHGAAHGAAQHGCAFIRAGDYDLASGNRRGTRRKADDKRRRAVRLQPANSLKTAPA